MIGFPGVAFLGRALADVEVAVLRALLSADFDGVAALRAQVDQATVVGGCACGCPSIELAVPGDVPRANVAGRLAPVEGRVGEYAVILFLDDGRLSYLELIHTDDEPPATWPPASALSIIPRV